MILQDREIAEVVEKVSKQLKGQGPRSKIVEAILVLLHARPMKSAEIASYLGYTTRYVSSYLSYWKTRGLVEYVGGYWQLTPLGENIAQQIIDKYKNAQTKEYILLAQQIISEQVKPAMNNNNISVTPGHSSHFLSFIAAKTGQTSPQQAREQQVDCIKQAIKYDKLSDEEKEIVNILLEHYITWGSTYLYVDQLMEALHANEVWLMQVLKKLQVKHIVYLYQDPRLGTRVGFSKTLRKIFNTCKQ